MELGAPFAFTGGCKTMRIAAEVRVNPYVYGSLLFDLENDPRQEHPIADAEIEERMLGLMVNLIKQNDAPAEQYRRLGIPQE